MNQEPVEEHSAESAEAKRRRERPPLPLDQRYDSRTFYESQNGNRKNFRGHEF